MERQKIFISYRRSDAAGHAGRLYDSLVQRFGGDRVFLDVDAIGVGRDFETKIGQEMDRSAVVIAVIGRNWLRPETDRDGANGLDRKDYVRLELVAAMDKNLPIIPVLVSDTDMPEATRLPDELARIARSAQRLQIK